MNFRRSSQQPASARVEQGFTLIEVLICVVLMTMIMGAITGALISSLHQSSSTNQQVHESNDAQIIAGFLVRDAQSAGGTNPATGVADPGLGVAVPDVAGCAVPGTPVVGFHWIDFSPAGNTTHIANYSFVAAAQGQFQAQQLVRTTCVTGVNGGAAVSVTVGTRVLSAPVVTCLVAFGQPPAAAELGEDAIETVTQCVEHKGSEYLALVGEQRAGERDHPVLVHTDRNGPLPGRSETRFSVSGSAGTARPSYVRRF